MSQKTIEILNGPSREELFDGLRLFTEKRFIPFTILNNGKEMNPTAWIHKIEARDKSGESWNIKFSLNKSFIQAPYPLEFENKSDFKTKPVPSVTVKAYYSTKHRKGTIFVEEERIERKYRLIVHNLLVNAETVNEIMNAELGKVYVLGWEIERTINYQAYPLNAVHLHSQTDNIVMVRYREM